MSAASTPVTLRAASDGSEATREAAARRASRPGDERPAAMARTSPSSSSSSVACEPRARPEATESASWSLRTEPDRALLNLAEGRSPTETRAALLGRENEEGCVSVAPRVAMTGRVGSEPPGNMPRTRATGRDAPAAGVPCTDSARRAGAANHAVARGAAASAERASAAAECACASRDCEASAQWARQDAVRARTGTQNRAMPGRR